MGESEAGGGKRGWWGQARLVGAGEANGGRKPPGQIPSQHYEAIKYVKLSMNGCVIDIQDSTSYRRLLNNTSGDYLFLSCPSHLNLDPSSL